MGLYTGRTRFSPELEALYGMEPRTFGASTNADGARPSRRLPASKARSKPRSIPTATNLNSTFRVQLGDKSVRWIASNGKIFRNQRGEPSRCSAPNAT